MTIYAVEKLNNNELLIEDILDDDDLIYDVRGNNDSQFAKIFSNEAMRKLIDYAIKVPKFHDHNHCYKFPFNACEILCSDTPFIIDKFFEETIIFLDVSGESDSDHSYSDNADKNKEIDIESDTESNISDDSHDIKKNTPNVEENNFYESDDTKINYNDNNLNTKIDLEVENLSNETKEKKTEIHLETQNRTHMRNHHINNATTEDIFSNEEKDLFNFSDDELDTKANNRNSTKEVKIFNLFFKKKTKNLYLLLDYFFDFNFNFNNVNTNDDIQNDETKFVLTGYFLKIFNHLLTQQMDLIIKYILNHFDIIDNLIRYLNLKSISECLLKLLLIDDSKDINSIKNINTGELNEMKIKILDNILSNVRESIFNNENTYDNENTEIVENISQLLLECFNNNKFYHLFIQNDDLFEKLHILVFDILQIEDQEIIRDLLKVLIKINENILKDLGITVAQFFTIDDGKYFTNNEEDINKILNNFGNINSNTQTSNTSNKRILNNFENIESDHFKKIFQILTKILEKVVLNYIKENNSDFITNTISTTFEQNRKVLGLQKLLEFEYIKSVIEIFITLNQNLPEERTNYINQNNLSLESASDSGSASEESLITVLKTEIFNNFTFLKNSNLFKKSIHNFLVYDLNNMYHILFEHLIKLIIHNNTPEDIINHIFSTDENNTDNGKNCNFLNILIYFCINESNLKLEFNSGRSVRTGHLSMLCQISNLIMKSENSKLKEILYNPENQFNLFVETFVEPIRKIFYKGLLRDIKSKFTSVENLYEYEYIEEVRKVPEGSKFSLDEIIKNGRLNFLSGDIFDENDDKDSINDKSCIIEENFGGDKFENNNLDQGFTNEECDEDTEMLLYKNNRIDKKNENKSNYIQNIKENNEPILFYDNLYWTSIKISSSFDIENILKDLDLN